MTSRWSQRWLPALLVIVTVFASGLAVGRGMEATAPREAAEVSSVDTEFSADRGRRAGTTDDHQSDERSRDTAVQAAAALVVAFDGPGLLDSDLRAELLQRHAVSTSRATLERTLGEVADRITGRLGLDAARMREPGFVWRLVPAGWQVRSFDPDEAVVAVWATGVVVAGGLPLAPPGWHTTEVVLRWERDAWRLAGFRSEAGPAPPTVGGTVGAGSQARLIRAFRPFRHLPDDDTATR